MASFDSGAVGVYFMIPGIADVVSIIIIGYVIAPRTKEFLGHLSVTESMGHLYGNKVRMISAISSIFPAVGNIAIQFVILSTLLDHFLGISGHYIMIVSSATIILYSIFGGIKAVTFTDIIQFITFGIVIPMVAFTIWKSLNNNQAIIDVIIQNPIFDYHQVFDYQNSNFIKTLTIFIFFLIPGLDPALFQRISMAKTTSQASRAFTISAFILLCLYSLFWIIGILLLADNYEVGSNNNFLCPDNILYILDKYMISGAKGLFVIGVVAILISTADSYINTSAILFTYDFCKTLGVVSEKNTLKMVRISSLLIGFVALFLSLISKNLIDLILSTYSFYMPIISVPLLTAIFGFRSSSKSVLMGMSAGFVAVIYTKLFLQYDSVMIGMIANLIFLIFSHYLLN